MILFTPTVSLPLFPQYHFCLSFALKVGTERPMVSQYREMIGHYKAPFVRRPAMWDHEPFMLSMVSSRIST